MIVDRGAVDRREYHAIMRGDCFAAKYDSDATLTIISIIRRYVAVETETPIPVPAAT